MVKIWAMVYNDGRTTPPGQLWVFKNPRLPKEELPEDSGLQRKLKRFFLDGGEFLEGRGFL